MKGRMINKKVVKTISIVLSLYMVLSPMVVYADELADTENVLESQVNAIDEAVNDVVVAVENEEQALFENQISNVDTSDITSQNTLKNTSELVTAEINRIESEAIKEAADAIINDVDMSSVNDALNTVSDMLDSIIVDETIATEIEDAADSLISIYEAQADAALDALKAISEGSDTVEILDDGSVSVDWNAASDEVQKLYELYQNACADEEKAIIARDNAKAAKDQLVKDQEKNANEINKLNNSITDENKEAISKSKSDMDETINNLIEANKGDFSKFKKDYNVEKNENGDISKFNINKVENGVAYGCLTYYDSVNKTILRKNFSISKDGSIEYNYVPKAEWVKENKKCTGTPVFGNGDNYVAAYVGDNIADYLTNKGLLDGKMVSDTMRLYVALNDLEKVGEVLDKAESELKTAEEKSREALENYKKTVALYKDVVSLKNEISNDRVEIAKLEYVRAEVVAWREQQVLNQVKEALNNSNATDNTQADNIVDQENIETVVNNIARNLGVEPAAVENMVVQTILDIEYTEVIPTNNDNTAAVAGVRKAEATKAEKEEIDNTKIATNNEVVEDVPEIQDEIQDVVTIEDNEVPLASSVNDVEYGVVNWWLPLIIALSFIIGMIFIVIMKNQKKEEAN